MSADVSSLWTAASVEYKREQVVDEQLFLYRLQLISDLLWSAAAAIAQLLANSSVLRNPTCYHCVPFISPPHNDVYNDYHTSI